MQAASWAHQRVCSSTLRRLARVWGAPDVSRLTVRVNPRLTRTLGRCRPSERTVELAAGVSSSASASIQEVLAHEAAHFVVVRRHGRGARPHGPERRALMECAGFAPVVSRTGCGERRPARRPDTLFLHTCPVCSFSRRAKRRVAQWRCPECTALGLPGELVVERIRR